MNQLLTNTLRSGPDNRGRFGEFGGRFVAETLMPVILEVEQAYEAAKKDPEFKSELKSLPNGLPWPPRPAPAVNQAFVTAASVAPALS